MISLFPASSLLHVLVFMPVEPLLAVHRISMIFQSLCLSLNCLLVSYKVISTTRQGSRSFISSETSFDWFRICVNRFACLNFFCSWYNGSVLKHGIPLWYHHYISFKNCVLLPKEGNENYKFVWSLGFSKYCKGFCWECFVWRENAVANLSVVGWNGINLCFKKCLNN